MNLPIYKKLDLATGEISDFPISEELFEKYLGGKILGAKLLYDLLPQGLNPLAPESILIINTGPVNGTTAPSSGRFNMTFKNVLTGGIASTNCGGRFGAMMKKAGLDGLIITGRAKNPVYIEIIDGEIALRDATELMGLNTERTQERFDKRWGTLVIGPAGENLVWYACAVSGERVAGRCGAGAVMGSKNLKAVVAFGTRTQEIYDKKKFDEYVKKWIGFLKKHPMTGVTLPRYGTVGLVSGANASGVLPTRNFSRGRFDFATQISGETLAENHLIKNNGCRSCPIRCERRVHVRGKEVKGPEFETVGLFGSNMENSDLLWINEINYDADLLGLDTISLAGTLAFAMELQENGIADFHVRFGDKDGVSEAIRKIAYREGIFSELANGSKWLSEQYGGKEYAIHAKGLELASYEPRRSVGMGLGYATSNRGGCHLNGGYLALIESVGVLSIDKQTPKGKPELTIMFQNMLEAVSAAGFCLFTAQAVIPSIIFKIGPTHLATRAVNRTLIASRPLLKPLWRLVPGILPFNSIYLLPHAEVIKRLTGLKMTSGRFMQLGERGFNIERLFNLREGLTAADDTLPERLTNTPQEPDDKSTVVPLSKMLPIYYKLRGWDKNGVPKPQKLRQLGLM